MDVKMFMMLILLSFIKWKDEMFKPNSKLLIEQILTCIQQQKR